MNQAHPHPVGRVSTLLLWKALCYGCQLKSRYFFFLVNLLRQPEPFLGEPFCAACVSTFLPLDTLPPA